MHIDVIVENGNVQESDVELFYEDDEIHRIEARDLPNLLVKLGVYKSTSQARNAGRKGDIPEGWTEMFKASKLVSMTTWNPTE